MAIQILRVGAVARILQGVQIHDMMPALNNQATDEMRTDKPGTAGNENFHIDRASPNFGMSLLFSWNLALRQAGEPTISGQASLLYKEYINATGRLDEIHDALSFVTQGFYELAVGNR
jgi:hypothetical protein